MLLILNLKTSYKGNSNALVRNILIVSFFFAASITCHPRLNAKKYLQFNIINELIDCSHCIMISREWKKSPLLIPSGAKFNCYILWKSTNDH